MTKNSQNWPSMVKLFHVKTQKSWKKICVTAVFICAPNGRIHYEIWPAAGFDIFSWLALLYWTTRPGDLVQIANLGKTGEEDYGTVLPSLFDTALPPLGSSKSSHHPCPVFALALFLHLSAVPPSQFVLVNGPTVERCALQAGVCGATAAQ